MLRRFAGFSGMVLPLWFTAVYFLVSSLRNDYRHFNMAISELGSVGAPNALLWNLLGYILSGGVIFYLGWVSRSVLPKSKSGLIVAWAIAISGIMMLLSGVFPGDFENRTSTTMILHTSASIFSYLFFPGWWFRAIENFCKIRNFQRIALLSFSDVTSINRHRVYSIWGYARFRATHNFCLLLCLDCNF